MKVDANRTYSPAAFQGLRKRQKVQIPDMLQMKPQKKKVSTLSIIALANAALFAFGIAYWQANKEKAYFNMLEHWLKKQGIDLSNMPTDSTNVIPDSTYVMPVDSMNVMPTDSVNVMYADSTNLMLADSTNVMSADSTNVMPADSTNSIPADSADDARVHELFDWLREL